MLQAAQIMIEKRAYFFKIIRTYLKYNRYEDIEDLYQELLEEAYLLKVEATKAYLAQKTAWRCIDYLNYKGLPVVYYDSKQLNRLAHVDNIEEVLEYERKLALLQSAVSQLKPRRRKIMQLLLQNEGTDAQLWQSLNIKQGAGESIKKFALIQVKQFIKEQENEQA